jgi:predicted DNA-binding protein (MmcQ/YjbR family)
MDIEKLREYCLRKRGVSESFPFNEYTLVFKVLDKIFCLADLSRPLRINLKCDPEKGLEYREEYDEIIPGYHMNKKHWNTIDLQGKLDDTFINEMIDDSYELVVNSLSKKAQNSLQS